MVSDCKTTIPIIPVDQLGHDRDYDAEHWQEAYPHKQPTYFGKNRHAQLEWTRIQ
jgi:hypothetical protein